jgi:hypothetical protein
MEFLAGLGLEAGNALEAIAPEANLLLVQANASLLASDAEAAVEAITLLAERVFSFYPFTPEPFPDNWRDILRCWLLGQPLAGFTSEEEAEALEFIEAGIVYHLPWAMEAVRVRAVVNADLIGDKRLALNHYELGLAVPAVETGTMNRSASMLIQAGFDSRLAAIKAVNDTAATFTTASELRAWLKSPVVSAVSAQPDWPTADTRELWLDFIEGFIPAHGGTLVARPLPAPVQRHGALPNSWPPHLSFR